MNTFRPVLLVASSLDTFSDGVVQAAGKFAESSGAELHLFHVIEQPRMSSFSSRVEGNAAFKAAGEHFELEEKMEALQRQAHRCIPDAITPASLDVSHDARPTYRAVIEKAKEVSATVIVLGPHSGADATARFLGTTVERILRTSEIPCLVLRGALGNPPSKIGAAIDLSDSTQAVLTSAGQWSLLCGKEDRIPELDVLYVGWWIEQKDSPNMEQETIRPAMERAFSAAQMELLPGEIRYKSHVLWENEPLQPIIDWSDKHDIDLLVLGTHGLTGLRRALLGSTASAVALRASCPILIVPPPADS